MRDSVVVAELVSVDKATATEVGEGIITGGWAAENHRLEYSMRRRRWKWFRNLQSAF